MSVLCKQRSTQSWRVLDDEEDSQSTLTYKDQVEALTHLNEQLSPSSTLSSSMSNSSFNSSLILVKQDNLDHFVPAWTTQNTEHVARVRYWTHHLFRLMPIVIGVPQVVFNLFVFFSVLLMETNNSHSEANSNIVHRSHRYTFWLIANQALVDSLLFVVEVMAVHFEMATDTFLNDSSNLTHFNLTSMSEMELELESFYSNWCHFKIGMWSWALTATLFSSVLITFDRFVFISYGLKYKTIINGRTTRALIALSWILSLLWTTGLVAQIQQEYDAECLVVHLVPGWHLLAILSLFAMVMCFIYMVYIVILCKFGKRKCRQQLVLGPVATVISMDAMADDNDNPTTTTNTTSASTPKMSVRRCRTQERTMHLLRGLAKVSNLTRSMKYVLILLIVLTLTWTPWFLANIKDALGHVSGQHNQHVVNMGCQPTQRLPPRVSIEVQLCLFRVFNDDRHRCLFVSESVEQLPMCKWIVEAEHAVLQEAFQKASLILAATNSLLNPVIYAFWYARFRRYVLNAWTKVAKATFANVRPA